MLCTRETRFFILPFLFAGCLLIGLSGCNGPAGDTLPDVADFIDEIGFAPAGTNLSVDVYLDATLSMQGYANAGEQASYVQMIDYLESAATLGAQTTLTYYRFGSQVEQLTRARYRAARKIDFYTNATVNRVTYIEKVIRDAYVDHLSVIVTDLFQDGNDVNLLVENLKQKVFDQGKALAVAGFMSDFEGTIYDIGRDNDAFAYTGKRPFYLLFFGRYADVERLLDNLARSVDTAASDAQFFVMSPHLVNPVASFKDARLLAQSNLLEPGRFRIDENQIKHFKVRDASATASLTIELDLQPTHYSMAYDPAQLDFNVTVWKQMSVQREEEGPPIDTLVVAAPDASEALNARVTVFTDSTLTLEMTLNPQELWDFSEEHRYFFRVLLSPESGAYTLPDWVSRWNMDLSRLSRWQQDPSSFNAGDQTQNLREFLNQLQRRTTAAYELRLAQLYFFLNP